MSDRSLAQTERLCTKKERVGMNGSEGGDRQSQHQRLKAKENALYPKPKDLGFTASDYNHLPHGYIRLHSASLY